MESIGKKMSWKEIVGKFPDRWVAISDYVFSGFELKEGVLQAVCEDTDISLEMSRLKESGKKIYWKRTTDLAWANVLWQDW